MKLQTYSLLQKILHWSIALGLIGLFALGLWMVELTYYDPWYRKGPDLHRSIGVIVVALMLFRIVWNIKNPVKTLASHSKLEKITAKATQGLMYLAVIFLGVSGYMITTATGQPVEVFNLISIPAINFGIEYQEEIAGKVHEFLAWSLVVLVVLHVVGALKHHFIDKDETLKRMLK